MKLRLTAVAAATIAIASFTATAATAAPAKPSNSPASAHKFKTFHRIGKDWTIEVTSIQYNANKACQKADRLTYAKPKKGYVYVVVQYTGKKLTGGKKQNLGDAIQTNVETEHGKQYAWDYNIVAPHPAATAKKAGKGQKTSGGLTYMV